VTAGRAYQVSPATDIPLLSKGQIRLTANRVYRVTAEVRQLTKPTNNSKNIFTIGLWGLDASFNALAYTGAAAAVNGFIASPASVAVADGWIKVAADVTIGTTNTAVWGRTYLKIAANVGSIVQVMSLTIEDVTESQRAKGSADAAAVSASNASASDTAAGLKASAALTSATQAATSKDNSDLAAGRASVSAGNASTSASQASTSETNALGSASAAGTSATNAAQSATNAGNSATAAAGSASTAGTKATDAGNSATAANTSAANAASSFTSAALVVSKLFPDRYDATGQLYFTSTPIGDPKTVTDAPSNATASNYGSVRELVVAAAATLEFGSRNVLPATAGKIYRIEVEFQRTALTGTAATVSLLMLGMNSAYASLGTVGSATAALTGSVQTATFMFSNAASTGITAWTASSVWLRPFVRVVGVTGSNSTTVQVRRLTVTDVTSEMAATNSATAAALSASNASTQADAAGSSATSATTSANTATSQAGTATTQAGIATTKASDAGTAATNAGLSAGTAGTAATNAGLSATAAQGVANNLLPDRPSIKTNFVSTTAAPSPETVTPLTLGTIVAVANEGDVLQNNAVSYVITRGWIGLTAARTYQQDIRWRATADGAGSVTGSWFLYDSASVYLGAVSIPFDASLTVAEGWRTFTNQTTTAALLAAYPTASYVRAGVYFNTAVVWQLNILRLRDVTDTVIAQNAASAASTSASNADTSATLAGQKASASNQSATNAATSANNALTSEGNAKTSEGNAKLSEGNANTFSGQASTFASNASQSASDAAGSANTATIQAGVASTSVGTVFGTINTAPILPSDFRNGLTSWTNARVGSPTNIAIATTTYSPGTSIVTNDTDFGSAYQSNWTTAGQNILPVGVVAAAAGRIFEIIIRFKVTVLPADGSVAFHIAVFTMLADYTQTTGIVVYGPTVNVTTTGVTELRVKISDTTTAGADIAWGFDTRFFRPSLRLNTSETSMTIRVGSIQIVDVTEKLAAIAAATTATNQATAAAGSATTAGTAVTNAGNSATAANTSAVNAASSYNATVATAANLFPERLDATGSTFYYSTTAALTAGSPTAIAMATGDQTKIITETNYGLVYNFSGLTGYFANRGVVPAVASRVYEVTYEFNLSVYGSAPFVPKIALEGMTTTYTDLGLASFTLPTVSAAGIVTGTVRFSNTAATGITAWPTNSIWLRPVFYGTGGTGATIYIRRLTVKDITSVVNAEFQATAAATSASTASTQAGLAGGSATSATTASNTATSQAGIATTKAGDATTQAGIATTQAGTATTQAGIATTQAGLAGGSATTAGAAAAAAQIVANALLPDRPSLKTNFVSVIGAGTPDAATPLTLGTVVAVTNEGDVLQNNAISYIITRGWIGLTAGRVYQMDARWAVTTSGAGSVTGSWFLYDSTGAYLGAVSIPYDSTLTVAEGFKTYTNQTFTSSLLAAYATAAYVRAGIYFNTTMTWQANILRLRDVTDTVTAQNAATAASTSASNADTSATLAGQSASASNTQATNAATSATAASGSAGAALGSAGAAAGSAGDAAGSAQTALGAAANAGTFSGQASTYATNASKSASDALGSANTATIQAGVASTSVGTIQATAASLMPERLDGTTATFTLAYNGSPATVNPLPLNGYVGVLGYGAVYQFTTTAATAYDIYTVGTVPYVAGRFYAIEIELNAATIASGETGTSLNAQPMVARLDGTYAGDRVGQSLTYLADTTVKIIPALWSFGASSSGYTTIGSGTFTYMRFGIRINSTKAGNVINVRRLRVVDVTSQVLASQSATAAAGSASTAGTAVTNAGNSATAANTSAVNAASSSNVAMANAAYTFPGRFPTDANFWVTNDQAPTATGSLLASATAYTPTATGFQWNRALGGTYQEIRTRGWVPVTGIAQYFRVDVRARVLTAPDDATPFTINIGMRGGDTAFAYAGWSNAAPTAAFTTDWTTQSVTTTDLSFIGSATVVQSHVCLQIGKATATTGIIEIASVAITNVTSERAAGLSATAAATSASTASTQAGLAGASSTSATTASNTATSQAGIATTKAGDATTQAGIATTKAGDATTQAGIATTQAGIATTKAGDATTQAGLALNYAATATDAAVAAQTVANLLIPDRPSIRSNFVSTTAAGTPSASTALTFGSVVAVANEGDVLQNNAVSYVITRGWLPITAARTYQQDIRWAPLGDGAGSVTGSWFLYNSAGAYLGAISIPFDSSITVAEGWRTFTNTTTSTALTAAYATAAYVRVGVYFNTSLTWQVSMVRVRDVTELVAAQNAASAASTSASNADTSATLAGQSATASNTQATNAATSATGAKGSQDAAKLSQDAAAGSAGDAAGSAGTAVSAAADAVTYSGQASTYASNASKSASDALGSANTATTQAGVSSSSAAQATLAVSAVFPSDFSQNGRFFIGTVTGDPATRTPVPDSKFITLANVGQVFATSAGDVVATRGALKPVMGRTYELEVSLKVMSLNTNGGNSYITPQIVGLNSDYSEGGAGGAYSAVAVSGFAATDNNRAIDTDFAVFKVRHTQTNVNTAWIRPRVILNYNGGTGASGNQTIYVRYMRFTDVTDIIAAANSATAAAGSASTAGTKATDSGNSATAANTSAVNAASSMTSAQQAALFTNPKTFEQDALYFAGDSNSVTPANISFVTVSCGRYAQNVLTTTYGYISWKSCVPHTAGRSYRITAKVMLASGDITKTVGLRISTYNTQQTGVRVSMQNQEQVLTTVGTLVTVVKEFTVSDGSSWVRPELVLNWNGTGGAVHQALSLEMIDITSEKASAGSATAAAGSASTADTRATDAGNSATAANTSAVNAASSYTGTNQTAAALLPSDFSLDGRFFSLVYSGPPSRAPMVAGGEFSFANVTGLGRVAQVNTATTTRDISPLSAVNVIAGRKYRMFWLGLDANYSHFVNTVVNATPTTTWQTLSITFDSTLPNATGVAYVRPLIRTNGTNVADTVQWSFVKIEDVTSELASAGSATAAAGSASTAGTKADAASNSATAANTSAVNAASSYTAANNAARALFPDLINNTAQVFAYTENGSGAPSAFSPIPAAQYVTDPDLGVCFERPWTTSPAGVGFIDLIPMVVGRIYQMEVQAKLVSSSFTSVNLSPNMRPLAADYSATGVVSNVQLYAAMAMTVGAVKTVKWLFGLGDGVVPVSSDNTVGRTTHSGATVWLRPYMRVEATGTGSGVVRFARITITDVTQSQLSANSATAAAGSASTAGTKATDSGNSATAANTSAANAASTYNATNQTAIALLPSDFSLDGRFFSLAYAGAPTRTPMNSGSGEYSFVTVDGIGRVLQINATGTNRDVSPLGAANIVTGRKYRLTTSVRVAATATGVVTAQLAYIGMDANYGGGTNKAVQVTPTTTWQTMTLAMDGTELAAAGVAWARPRLRTSGTVAADAVQWAYVKVEDVTSEVAATNSASAAADSASTAGTKADAAGNSATAANTSAANAASSLAATNNTALRTIPKDFAQLGQFYSLNGPGPTAPIVPDSYFRTIAGVGSVMFFSGVGPFYPKSKGYLPNITGRVYRITGTLRALTNSLTVRCQNLTMTDAFVYSNGVSSSVTTTITPAQGWQTVTLEVTGDGASVYFSPQLSLSGVDATTVIEIRTLTMDDVTSEKAALNSATAAAGSASTADTRATDAGNSATAANTSNIGATSAFNSIITTQNTAASLPSDFSNGLQNWTLGRVGGPLAAMATPGGTLGSAIVTGDPDFGTCYEGAWYNAGGNIMTRGLVPATPKRIYEVRVRFKITVLPTDGVANLNIGAAYMIGDYTAASLAMGGLAFNTNITSANTVYEMVAYSSDTTINGATAWPSDTKFIRYGLRNNADETGMTIRIGMIKVTDVTEAINAQQASTAAALSATTATTKATDAGNSATTANTSALNAASAFTSTQNAILYTNPTTFEQDALYFAGDNGATTPSGTFVTDASARLFQNISNGVAGLIQWKAGIPHKPGSTYRITSVVRVSAFATGQTTANVQLRCNVYSAQVGGTRVTYLSYNTTVTVLNTFVTIQNDFLVPDNAGTFIVPEVLINFPTANTIMQAQSLQMTDVTSQLAAAGSAGAANTSAGTAKTQADAAGVSAGAANTSNLAAQAAQATTQAAAVALFPERLDNLAPAFTYNSTGSPSSVPALPASGFINSVGYGTVYQFTNPNNSASYIFDIATVSVLPYTTGRFYKVEWEFQVSSFTAGDAITTYTYMRALDGSYAQVGSGNTSPLVNVLDSTVKTLSATFGCNVGGGDVNVSMTGVTWLRPVMRLTSMGKASIFQIRRIKVTDVTSQMQAASSASAANVSAGTADSRATDAGNSATAANTSALNAASSFGSSNLLAAKSFPDRLDGIGDYFGTITGDPKTVPAITTQGSVVNVSGYGLVWQTPVYTATSYRDVATRQVLPGTLGRIYKVEAEYQITTLAAGDVFNIQLAVRTLDSTYAGGAINFGGGSGVTATTVQTVSANVYSSGAPAGGYNYGTPTYLRFYVRFNNAAVAGSVVQFRRLTVTDITESYNANLSAVAANTSAGTASTKADAAGTSADAANTSKLAAASSYTATAAAAVALLPERADNTAPAWSSVRIGTPSSITPFPASQYVNVAGYGNVIQTVTATTAQFGVDQIGTVPYVQGRFYRVEYEYQVTAMDTGAPIMQSIVVPLLGTYALNGTGPFFASNFAVTDTTVQVKTLVFGCNVVGGDYNITTAGTVWLRFEGKLFNGSNTGSTTWQFRRMKVTDVTSEILAGKSASVAALAQSAASNSASDAAGSATNAAGSSSDATTSKNLAASSALQARTIATQIFPSDFSQDGLFFTNAVTAQAPADITVGAFVNYADSSFVFRGGFLPSGTTVARSTIGSRTNESGAVVSEAVNAPRFENTFSTAWTVAGLLNEPASTNNVRNNTMVGASAGVGPTNWNISSSGNGLTRTVVGTGIQNGINYVDIRFNGTATAVGHVVIYPETNIVAATGDTWTGSLYVSLVAGTDPGTSLVAMLAEFAAGNYLNGSSKPLAPTATLNRLSITRVFNQATTTKLNFYIDLSHATGVTYDFTLRVGLPQIEKIGVVTSPIFTSTVPVTRAADVVTLNWGSLGIADGTITARYTFDNGTTQDVVTVISGGVSTVPTNLNRPIIRRVDKI
jgi:hypothetical protein